MSKNRKIFAAIILSAVILNGCQAQTAPASSSGTPSEQPRPTAGAPADGQARGSAAPGGQTQRPNASGAPGSSGAPASSGAPQGQRPAGAAAQGGAGGGGQRVSVETLILKETEITNKIKYNGTTAARKSYNISPEIAGRVEAIHFDVGDRVKAGDVLFTLSQKDLLDSITQYETQLLSSDASVNTAETNLALLDGSKRESTIMQLETAIKNAKTALENAKLTLNDSDIQLNNSSINVKEAEIKMNTAKTSFDNTKRLYDVGGTTKSDLTSSETAYNQTVTAYTLAKSSYEQVKISNEKQKVSLEQAETNLANAEKSYNITLNGSMPEDKKIATNTLNSALASRENIRFQLKLAKDKLNSTTIKSPINGVISAKTIDAGSNVTTSTVAYTILDTEKMIVTTNLTEQLVVNTNVGDDASVVISTVNPEPLSAKVVSINPLTDNTGTYPVRLEVPNPDGKIKIGMFAEVTFNKEDSKNTYSVPRDAIITDERGRYVYVVIEGKAKKVAVETGIDNGREIELKTGVKENDEVIVKGQNYVLDGTGVTIVNK